MTGGAGPRQDQQDLFVADFHPLLGEYLAERHGAGYDAAGRARFRAWLAERTKDQANDQTSDRTSG